MTENKLSLGDIQMEHFADLIGDDFTITYPDLVETLRLEEVRPGKVYTDPRFRRQPFSLFFTGNTPNLLLNQQMHPLSHHSLGCHDIMIAAIGQNPDGTIRYQAAFS